MATRWTAWTRLLAAPAAALLLAACGGGGADAPRRLVLALPDEPSRLDPAFNRDLYEGIVSGFIFDGLVGFGRGTEIEPRLAESWETSADGRAYTFHLRDARFCDGRPVTSDDVRYSYTRLLRPETNSGRRWVVNRIAGAAEVTSGTAAELAGLETPDARTVRITLDRPYPPFLTLLAMPAASVIPRDAAGRARPDPAFNRAPVGTGPWRLRHWLRDQRLEFEPNPHFWGGRPGFDRLTYQVLLDENARQRLFEVGAVDICQVGFAVHDHWMRDPARAARMKQVQELRTDYIGFMNHKGALRDPRVRRALSHAVDVEAVFRHIQKGRGVVAHGPVPPGIPGHRADAAPRAHDPALARRLLDEAVGGGAAVGTLRLWYRDEALNAEVVRKVRDDLAEVGVKVEPVPRDLAGLRAGIWEGAPDLFMGSWTLDYPDAENALVPTFHSRNIPRQGNGSRFSDPAVDRLLEEAEAQTDPQKRVEAFRRAEDAVREACPWIFLFHRRTFYAVGERVEGWEPALMYNADRYTPPVGLVSGR